MYGKHVLIQAPAKINLALDVRGKREDGYHLVDMILQTVSLYDDIYLELDDSGAITLEVCGDTSSGTGALMYDAPVDIPRDETNLAFRAAEAFFGGAGESAGYGTHIRLVKRIPAQAGLGGGSSDAAAVLVGLHRLLPGRFSGDALFQLAASLGADVPFFLEGGTMRATGTGTCLRKLRPMSDRLPVLIVKPDCGNSTPKVYAAFDETDTGDLRRPDMDELTRAIEERNISLIMNNVVNVLAYPVTAGGFESAEIILKLRESLREAGAAAAEMSGSGTAVFGIFTDAHTMRAAAAKLSDTDCAGRIAGIYETIMI